MIKMRTNRQSGVASLFVVVFFMLLISIIVIGFAQIVNQDQRQVTNTDLSSSAYDSAQAGVEDAKRALAQFKKTCIETKSTEGDCDPATGKYLKPTDGAFSGASCSAFQDQLGEDDLKLKIDDISREVRVTTDSSDEALDQAYTCLKFSWKTNDYKRTLKGGNTILIPLKTVSGSPSSIRINWFDKSQATNFAIPSDANNFKLPQNTAVDVWDSQTPPIIRAQIISVPKNDFSVDEIDAGSRTVFLYPSTAGSGDVEFLLSGVDAGRRNMKIGPVAAKCDPDSVAYACSATLRNFSPGAISDYNYYIRITPIYGDAKMQIQMFDVSNSILQFDGVEPEVDSTGRANNVFRRVVSRIAFDIENSGIDVTQGLCKNFSLADGDNYYTPGCDGRNDLIDE